jgi:hypothetical protein
MIVGDLVDIALDAVGRDGECRLPATPVFSHFSAVSAPFQPGMPAFPTG